MRTGRIAIVRGGYAAGMPAVAITGPLALIPVIGGDLHRASGSATGMAGAYGFLRVLVAWCLAPAFVVVGICAPPGRPRRWLLVAVGLECLTAAYLLAHFFFTRP